VPYKGLSHQVFCILTFWLFGIFRSFRLVIVWVHRRLFLYPIDPFRFAKRRCDRAPNRYIVHTIPCSLNCRENPVLVSAKLANFAHFSRFLLVKPACGERTTGAVARTSPPFFSAAAIGSPTSSISFGEDLAIGKRTSYEPNLTSFPGSPVPCLFPGCPSSRHQGPQ
jgi:hypothetical protein